MEKILRYECSSNPTSASGRALWPWAGCLVLEIHLIYKRNMALPVPQLPYKNIEGVQSNNE